mmetsp:Transcript_7162/g.12347  ORF Transcript_7162/g.12347 Transcript_7162/m.12347 type:complete len:128 (+) Transcript_7162:210-593(+)|eukprot:CAMPEP_0119108586 /NCGR_PEP_ID=MMETSP1180-20130426/15221_1 /TAXON_ID=3052 ORGANISM="Chlamydomonas cf sp, Strain CCMP681" /NCGR_SAMPLE_ID=MMETSP1180 /ASSEMBLY_ACC=CAM_ASM_000741 /LENGTH=127 /DNA_ID=CAMNT_0007094211 /DNA_START=205 /DNA_END=588 /DNA_ORIENTATION=+
MSFVGGKLKFKGDKDASSAGVKKKKKKTGGDPASALALAASTEKAEAAEKKSADLKKILHGHVVPTPSEHEDRRTDAEKRFAQRQIQLEQERLKKLANKSHRDRVKDFNEQLAALSEHHDIPRVGPG